MVIGDWGDDAAWCQASGQGFPPIIPENADYTVNPKAWDAWLASLPESENIEDRRGDDRTREVAAAVPFRSIEQLKEDARLAYKAREAAYMKERQAQIDENVEKWLQMIKERDEQKKRSKK